MIRCLLIVAILLSLGFNSQAQENLIRNWSFEDLKWPDSQYPCPTAAGQIGQTKHWNSAHGSVDYFNACSNENWPLWGVPSNLYGQQEAYDGEAYAALTTYTPVFSNAREYLWQSLTEPLTAGQGYSFSCWVSLCDSMNWASDGLGVLFTEDDTRLWPSQDFLNSSPQIVAPSGQLYSNKEGWEEFAGAFVAKGGEKYMTIGAFSTDNGLSVIQVSSHPPAPYNWNSAVYYIDAVSLTEMDDVGLSKHGEVSLTLFPNPADRLLSVHVGGPAEGGKYIISNLVGRTELKGHFEGTTFKLNVGGLAEGVHTIFIQIDGGLTFHRRFVLHK